MTEEDADAENRQFEQVLSRLDALMKRSHADEAAIPAAPQAPLPDLPLPAETIEENIAEPAAEVAGSAVAAGAEDAAIPVLTDVYAGILPARRGAGEAGAEAATIDALLPALLDACERIIQEESARMRQSIAARLSAEVAEALRQTPFKGD